MSATLLQAAAETVLLADGAMGTQLQLAGLQPGACGELWNLKHPARVLAVHQAYVDAGADCLLTNTFGGNTITLERHGQSAKAAEINRAGVRLAREAFGQRNGFVIGDIGPFGGIMEPLGDTPEQLVFDAFLAQAKALVAEGVDAIIIETQTALEELVVGIRAARDAKAPCVIASLAYDVSPDKQSIRTMMGVQPEQAAEASVQAGADVISLNCGKDMDMSSAAKVVERYRRCCSLPIMAKPNGGSPTLVDGKLTYRQTPQAMAADAPQILAAGARIIGGCCGSTPAHIRALRALLDA